jgi:signal transduction histidine kinase/CheY-like chemotaxis protein
LTAPSAPRGASLARRLFWLVAVTAVSAVVLAAALLGTREYRSYREHLLARTATVSRVVAANAAAAVEFADESAARDLLSSLATERAIVGASLLSNAGRTVTRYRSAWASLDAHATADLDAALRGELWHDVAPESWHAENGLLLYSVPVTLRGEKLGTLRVIVSPAELHVAMRYLAIVLLTTTLIAALVAIAITARLRRKVVAPVKVLGDAMEQVRRTQDYALRVVPTTADEVGRLFEYFNSMLQEVRARDDRLEHHRRELEQTVQTRTAHLETALEAAKQASRAKSDFLARMSHEIRTPMNGVLGMAELLGMTSLDGRQQRLLGTMRSSAESLLQIIDDILDFSKIEAGRMQIGADACCANDVIEEVCEMLAPRAHAKSLELACRMTPAAPVWVRGDAVRLRQIVTNLVGNAIKFTDRGEIVVEVRTEPRGARVAMQIAVADTGIGMSAADRERVFDVFTQADSFRTRSRGGTGLGLSITRELLRLMGGTISVESELGRGSRFVCELELPAATPLRSAAFASLNGTRILVADDNDTNREILVTTLTAWHAQVTSVPDGTSTLELLRSGCTFDLAILDHRMPGVDGVECARRIAADPALGSLAVVVLSSVDSIVAVESRTPDAACEFLTKPVRHARLYECLTRLLARAKSATMIGLPALRATADVVGLELDVLLAEDNEVNQAVAVGMLETLGCRVHVAANGAEAVALARRRPFDIVLMDCQMPVMDGYTATERLRAAEREEGGARLPIVALTANALQGDREHCIAAGMDDFLSKPYTVEQLRDLIVRTLDRVHGTRGRRPSGGDVRARAPGHASTPPAGSAPAMQAPPASDPPVLDVVILDELERLGSRAVSERIVAAFVDGVGAQCALVRNAASEGDLRALEAHAHKLRSGALGIGGRRAGEIAGAVERAAREGDLDRARERLRSVPAEIETLRQALEGWKSRPEEAR